MARRYVVGRFLLVTAASLGAAACADTQCEPEFAQRCHENYAETCMLSPTTGRLFWAPSATAPCDQVGANLTCVATDGGAAFCSEPAPAPACEAAVRLVGGQAPLAGCDGNDRIECTFASYVAHRMPCRICTPGGDAGPTCVGGVGEPCTAEGDCGAGLGCGDGYCGRTCTTNADCPSTMECVTPPLGTSSCH
jgi:hypothetical protein